MNSMREAFEDLVKDTYSAEKQIEKALPKVIEKAHEPQLVEALQGHLKETKEQIKKVEEIAKMCDFKPTGVVCHGMMGLIEEVDEHISEGEPGPVMDAMIISNGQKIEHYEICAYGTMRAWAMQLGLNDIIPLIEENLQQEEAANSKMNHIAVNTVNVEAAGEKAPKSKASVR